MTVACYHCSQVRRYAAILAVIYRTIRALSSISEEFFLTPLLIPSHHFRPFPLLHLIKMYDFSVGARTHERMHIRF